MSSSNLSKDLQKLEYYTAQAARRTLISRVALLTIIFGMLSANMWQTERNYEAMIININQTRLAQDQLHDTTTARISDLEQQLVTLQHSIDLLLPPVEVAAID
ncbi:MAG: hypothetical protein ACI8S6_003232 [Myxococcota bacterium]|jgi:hypothetical protein